MTEETASDKESFIGRPSDGACPLPPPPRPPKHAHNPCLPVPVEPTHNPPPAWLHDLSYAPASVTRLLRWISRLSRRVMKRAMLEHAPSPSAWHPMSCRQRSPVNMPARRATSAAAVAGVTHEELDREGHRRPVDARTRDQQERRGAQQSSSKTAPHQTLTRHTHTPWLPPQSRQPHDPPGVVADRRTTLLASSQPSTA